jgi:hypothetical protein
MNHSSLHSRRKFLKLGLAGMALPPFASLLGAQNGARPATTGKPARLVTIFFPNGVSLPPEKHSSFNDWHWFPHNPGSDYVMTKTLQPLAGLRNDFSILSGFSHPNLRSNITHSCSAQFLTGEDQSKGYKNSISYDQMFAGKIDGATRFSSIALSTTGGTGSVGRPATISVNRDGALVPAMSEPQQIFDRLFVVDERGAEERARDIARDRSILDRVSSRLSRLNGTLAAEDRAHLDAYLTATRSLERQLGRANDWLNIPKPKVDPDLFDFDAQPTRELGTNYMRTMFDLIHMALLTDSTRVVTYQTAMENAAGRGNKLPYAAGLSMHHHQLSHSAARDEGGWERWAKYDQYLAERLSEFLTKMAQTPDPLAEGSLLDNTIVLYGCGTSKTHVGRNYPLIVAGGKNLGLKHGTFHRFEDERPFNDLLLTLLQQTGVETERFGDSEGTVDQILV